jgi:hypothetical protein
MPIRPVYISKTNVHCTAIYYQSSTTSSGKLDFDSVIINSFFFYNKLRLYCHTR